MMFDVDHQIGRYAAAERLGRARVPNAAIQAFGLEAFSALGYPSRIEHSGELWRYHDVMQDGRFSRNLRLIGEPSAEVLAVAQRAIDAVVSFSESRFQFKSAAKDMLSRAIYQFQLISNELKATPRPWSILEIGPGCGYLGLLVGLAGDRYTAVEASQAFYVYQSTLYRDVFGDDYQDGLEHTATSRIGHLPWWELCRESSRLPAFTAATANHMLSEMNPSGLAFLFGKLYTTQSSQFRVIAESLGSQPINTYGSVVQNISNQRFSAHEQSKNFWVFRPASEKPVIQRIRVTYHERARRFILRKYLVIRSLPIVGTIIRLIVVSLKGLVRKGAPPSSSRETIKPVSSLTAMFAPYADFESAEYRFQKRSW